MKCQTLGKACAFFLLPLVSLASCSGRPNPTGFSRNSSSASIWDKSQAKPGIFHEGAFVPLSEFNSKTGISWGLEHEIRFLGAPKRAGKAPSAAPQAPAANRKAPPASQASDSKMRALSICRSAENSHSQPMRNDVHFKFYKARFRIADLLPEEVFSEMSGQNIACSFDISVKDGLGNSILYKLSSLPLSSEMQKGFWLKFTDGEKEADTSFEIVPSTMNSFALALDEERKADQIKFLCRGEGAQTVELTSQEQIITSPLQRLLSKESSLALGPKTCRILALNSKAEDRLQGATNFFILNLKNPLISQTAPEGASHAPLQALIIKKDEEEAVSLAEASADPHFKLDLADKIFFKGMREHPSFDYYERPFVKHSSDQREMRISSQCSLGGEKNLPPFQRKLPAFMDQLPVLSLLPLAALSPSDEKDPLICSFAFVMRDKNGQEQRESLALRPVANRSRSALAYLQDRKKPKKGIERAVNQESIRSIGLILERENSIGKMEFLCENGAARFPASSKISSQYIPLFWLAQAAQAAPGAALPSGGQTCRILAYGKKGPKQREEPLLEAASEFFVIDFSSAAPQEPPQAKTLDLDFSAELISAEGSQAIPLSQAPYRKEELKLSLGSSVRLKGLDKLKKALQDSAAYPQEAGSLPLIHTLSKCRFAGGSSKEGREIMHSRSFPLSQAQFPLPEMMPERAFSEAGPQGREKLMCSFEAYLLAAEGLRLFSLPEAPVAGAEKGFALQLKGKGAAPLAAEAKIKREDMQHIELSSSQSLVDLREIKFLCGEKSASLSMNAGYRRSIAPFRRLISAWKPQYQSFGKRRCRILAYGHNQALRGITKPFQIDFSGLAPVLSDEKIKALSVEIDFHSPQEDPLKEESSKDPVKEEFGEDVTLNRSVFKIPGLFESFAPHFSIEDYKSHKIRVDTSCKSLLFANRKLKINKGTRREREAARARIRKDRLNASKSKSYDLPLMESFSLMAVTPQEALHIYFPKELSKMIRRSSPESLMSNRRSKKGWSPRKQKEEKWRRYHPPLTCSYKFYIKNDRGQIPFAEVNNRKIGYSPGNYGISLAGEKWRQQSWIDFTRREDYSQMISNDEWLRDSWPLFMKSGKDAPHIPIEFSFLNREKAWRDAALSLQQPDKLNFVCGAEDDANSPAKTHISSKRFDPQSVRNWQLSHFSGEINFLSYLKKSRFVKCRLILYQGDILRYFSQEIKFIHGSYDQDYKKLNKKSTHNKASRDEEMKGCADEDRLVSCWRFWCPETCQVIGYGPKETEKLYQECLPECQRECVEHRKDCIQYASREEMKWNFYRLSNFFYWL